jgi:hypothetical protein
VRVLALALLVLLAIAGVPKEASAQIEARCRSDIPLGQEFSAWAGPWANHSAVLNVREDGCGALSWRTYQPCRFGVYDGACDPVVNGEIGHGGKAVFILAVRDGVATSGQILARTATTDPPNFGIVLRLKGDGTMGVEWDGAEWRFCRTWAWAPLCGA